jgi:DNA-directed RNA polymerase subunit alpha
MKWKNLRMPEGIAWEQETLTPSYGKLVAEPLERGYGITVGNSLRRVLLSSLQGAAVTSVRIDGALHEFSVLPGVTEDVTEIVLNLKQLRLKLLSDGPETLHLKALAEGDVKASDFQPNPNVQILNPDHHIATLGADAKLTMEMTVGTGRGYVQAEDHGFDDKPIGFIAVDSVFSPVRKVSFAVENTRVGQRTDYDKLTLEVWTDGTVSPVDAVSSAAKLLKDHLLLFMAFDVEPFEEQAEEVDEDRLKLVELLNHSVEELELSVRSSNCLRDAGIRTLGDLVRRTEAEMLKYRNFGRKSLQELVDILSDLGLHFDMDVEAVLAGQPPAEGSEPEEEPVLRGGTFSPDDEPPDDELEDDDAPDEKPKPEGEGTDATQV